MNKMKTMGESSFVSRKLVMPDQINPHGTLFGGVMLSWIDKVAYMTAQRHAERPRVVTVNIEQVSFDKPVKVGDHVVLRSQITYVGKSSMEILVRVDREVGCNPAHREEATRAYLTFVALDENGKPAEVPRIVPDSDEDQLEFERSSLRQRIRTKVTRRLARLVRGSLEVPEIYLGNTQ